MHARMHSVVIMVVAVTNGNILLLHPSMQAIVEQEGDGPPAGRQAKVHLVTASLPLQSTSVCFVGKSMIAAY